MLDLQAVIEPLRERSNHSLETYRIPPELARLRDTCTPSAWEGVLSTYLIDENDACEGLSESSEVKAELVADAPAIVY